MKFILYLGLIMNIAGTLLISFSFGKNLEDTYQTDKNGAKIYLASFLRPARFKWGIIIVIVGFCVQLLYTIVSP
jgi:hypothetical protein